MAVADEQRVEALFVDVPAAAFETLRVLHRRAEPDALPQAERVGVLAQEVVDLRVVREVRIAMVHREVPEADRGLGRVDMQRAVGRRASVRVAEVPVAADVVARLEARMGDTPVSERLDRRKAADAGADHADVRTWLLRSDV